MKKIIYIAVLLFGLSAFSYAQNVDSLANSAVEQNTSYVNDSVATQVTGELSAGKNITKAMADSAYAKGDYAEAIEMYEYILANQGVSAAIYYNLGNSYYKNKNIARSILNLERAHLLDPGDSDIRFNLEMAKSKAVDKVDTVNEIFITTWIKDFRNCFNSDGWGTMGIVLFVCALLLLGCYIFGKALVLKKIGFIGAIICVIFVIISNIFAYQQRKILTEHRGAIIMEPSVTAKSTPDVGGTDLFILHEGHKVTIKDATMKEWREIQLEDGSIGWVPVQVLEVI